MLRHPFESCKLGIERFLEDGIIVGGNVLVLSFLEEIWKGLGDYSEAVKPKIRSTARQRPLIDLRLHVNYRFG